MHAGRMTHSRSLRILLVDDHPAVREGLALLLAPEGMEVCAEAAGRQEALARLQKCHPDLAIVDLSLEREDGTALIADLHKREVPVLVYSMHNDAPHVEGAFAAGALGYVTKREFHEVLVQAVREVAASRRFVSPHAASALAESHTGAQRDDAVAKLSPHEREVYQLLGQGEGLLEISAALNVSAHTVESYYSRIQVKLRLNGMYELRRHAIEYVRKHA
ncbi:MAG: response regulator transcription factor [Terriglobia bacterium]|jgi:DNA-binding NarL/FixJ family response regulator